MVNKRFDVVRCGIRITRTSGTTDPVEFRVREKILDLLAQNSKVATLQAFQDGLLSVHDLIQARDQGLLLNDQVLAKITLRRNLWETLDAVFPAPPPSKRSTQAMRYYVSAAAFARKAGALLKRDATVESLLTVDWAALHTAWSAPRTVRYPQGLDAEGKPLPDKVRVYRAGPSDWMHCRRMISAALTRITGSPHSPFRREVMAKIPTASEVRRMPEVDVQLFEEIVALTPEHVRPAYYVLFISGMRKSEYLRCRAHHLNPRAHTLHVPGRKTTDAEGIVSIDPELWPWLEAGIPAPVQEGWLGIHWRRARSKVPGAGRLTLHDLRHAAAMTATDEGAATAHIQALLRHSSSAMTLRYQARASTKHAADAIGRGFRNNSNNKRAS